MHWVIGTLDFIASEVDELGSWNAKTTKEYVA